MKYAIVIIASLALVGCDHNRSGAEQAVRDTLKDPESARFGEFYYNPKTKHGCLTVNAKNAMGGYTGNQQVLVENVEGTWRTGMIVGSLEMCKQIHADVAD